MNERPRRGGMTRLDGHTPRRRPADLVMLSGHADCSEFGTGEIWWYSAGTITTMMSSEPPDCNDIVPWCFGNWGAGGFWDVTSGLPSIQAGRQTGGDSLRKTLEANIAYSDGHCKYVQPAGAAMGPNFSMGMPNGNAHIVTLTSMPGKRARSDEDPAVPCGAGGAGLRRNAGCRLRLQQRPQRRAAGHRHRECRPEDAGWPVTGAQPAVARSGQRRRLQQGEVAT